MPVELRQATPADEPFLRGLYRSIRDYELALTPWSEEQKAAFANQQYDAQDSAYRENYRGAEFLVVVRDGEPIGRLYLHRGAEDIRVMDLALVPAARNAGIGTTLLKDVIARAEADGLAVTLHVETYNPVRRLYARLGFAEVSQDGIYILMRREARAATGG